MGAATGTGPGSAGNTDGTGTGSAGDPSLAIFESMHLQNSPLWLWRLLNEDDCRWEMEADGRR